MSACVLNLRCDARRLDVIVRLLRLFDLVAGRFRHGTGLADERAPSARRLAAAQPTGCTCRAGFLSVSVRKVLLCSVLVCKCSESAPQPRCLCKLAVFVQNGITLSPREQIHTQFYAFLAHSRRVCLPRVHDVFEFGAICCR